MSSLTLAQCFRALQLQPGASLAEVKTAFRKLAFQFHPDLNPSPEAASMFRKINEAYVLLSKTLPETPPGQTPGPGPEAEPRTGPAQGAQAYERQQRQARPEPPPQRDSAAERQAAWSRSYSVRDEDVLRDLLKDPFARQVFDDLYTEIRRDRPGYTPPKEFSRRRLQFQWGKRTFSLDLSRGLWGGVKHWFRSQMDDEQTVYFPAQHLLPGRSLRLSVRQFSGQERTVELTLPADFVVGRPIRLKGLGRKLGPLTGDLYLRVLAK